MIAPWTASEDARLTAAVKAGRSFADIAAELGRSRNSCAGRAHRLGAVSPKRPKMARATRVGLKGRPNLNGLFKASVARQQAGKRVLDEFAERLSIHGDVQRAAAEIGRSQPYGYSLFKRLQRQLGAQAV